jgi:hypothetical protein
VHELFVEAQEGEGGAELRTWNVEGRGGKIRGGIGKSKIKNQNAKIQCKN